MMQISSFSCSQKRPLILAPIPIIKISVNIIAKLITSVFDLFCHMQFLHRTLTSLICSKQMWSEIPLIKRVSNISSVLGISVGYRDPAQSQLLHFKAGVFLYSDF